MNTFKKLIVALSLSSVILPVAAETVNEAAVRIRERPVTAPVSTAQQDNTVKINVTPLKSIYRVGESIKFKVVGQQSDYYLYIFSVDQNTQKTTRLLPNAKTKDNYLRKNKTYTMPGTVDFYSDAAGVEKLIFIASPTPINLNNIPSETVGAFAINNMDDVANAFSSKAIRIREPESNAAPSNPQAGVKTVQLQIMP